MNNRVLPLLAIIITLCFQSCDKANKDTVGRDNSYYNHDRGAGASANDLLSGNNYLSVKVEMQYLPGFKPDEAAVEHLTSMLAARLNKPNGIQIVQKEIPIAIASTLSLQEVVAIEKQHRTVYTKGNQLGIYLLYTNGEYTNSNVLGIAYANTSMCLFGKTIHDNSGGVGQASRTKLEATVLEHEFGHILGLVNIGSAMQLQHEDGTHKGHCNDSNCLMYYAAETTDVLGLLITGNIPGLDENCNSDLRANGGK